MKLCATNIIVTITTLLWTKCLGQQITADEFTWKLIENSLNCTKNTENFVIAPYEAYQLYNEIFNIDDDDDESNEDKEQPERDLATVFPAIRKQLKTFSHNHTNQLDLLSSISLTARWSFNFQIRDTQKRVFHQFGEPNQKLWVDFLRKDDTFYYSHDDQLNASFLELPLNVKEIKLMLILPDQEDGLQELKENLLENLNEFNELIKKTRRMVLVRVLLPKFHLTYKKDLTDFFEEISSMDLEKYENVYQVSNLEFSERGIGRFEKTTVLFWNAYSYLRVSPELFDINHPFLFLITNKNGVQFFGQVVKM